MNKTKSNARKNFTVIPNELINDKKIPQQSRFMFIVLSCQSETFEFKNAWLRDMLNVKTDDALNKYWKGIEEAKWGYRIRTRTESGHYSNYDYILFAYPGEEEIPTSTGKTQTGKNPDRLKTSLGETGGHNKEEPLNKEETLKTKKKANFVSPTKQEVGMFMYKYMQGRKAFSKYVHPKYWAVAMAEEYMEHYENANWKAAGKPIKDFKFTAMRWVRTEEKRGALTKIPSNHEDYGKKPWEITGATNGKAPEGYRSPLDNIKKKGPQVPGAKQLAEKFKNA